MRKSAFLAVLLTPFALSACGDDDTTTDTGDDTTSGTEAPTTTQTTEDPDSSTTDDPTTGDNGCTPDDQCRTADDCQPGQTCLANCTCFGEPSGDTDDACYADQGAYGNCIDEGIGACESGAGANCAQGGGAGVCFFPCNDACDCPAPPDGASVGCEAFIQDNPNSYCHLDCSGGKACPDGMTCFGNYLCVWPTGGGGGDSCAGNCGVYDETAQCQCDDLCVDEGDCCADLCDHCADSFPGVCEPPPPPAYHDCANNPAVTCGEETSCTSMSENDDTWAVCSQTGCTDASDCAEAPSTGNAPVACGDLGDGNVCYLDCDNQETCPDGMECTPDGYCAWAGQGFLLLEDFGYGQFRAGWTLIDADGFTPQLPFITDAWVVTDNINNDFAAVSTSWYDPEGQAADDWMITPQITLGPNSVLSWRARAPDGDYPDGYEVRISTTTPDVAGFTANAALFTIAAEETDYTERSVNLADEGYANEDVYIAFRNNSDDQFLLFVDDIAVTQ